MIRDGRPAPYPRIMRLLEATLRVHESAGPAAALQALVEALSTGTAVRAAWVGPDGAVIAAAPEAFASDAEALGAAASPIAPGIRAGGSGAGRVAQGPPASAPGETLVLPLPQLEGETLLLEIEEGWDEADSGEWRRVAAAFASVVERERSLENARTEQLALRQRAEESEALHVLGLAANRTLDPDEVVELVARFTRTLLGAHYVTVGTVQDESIRTVADVGLEEADAPPDDPLAALVVREQRPIPVGTEESSYEPDDFPLHAAQGMRVGLGVPLALFGDTFGALVVGYRRPYALTPRDTRLALTLAGHAAVAINNARLHRTLANRSRELERAYEELRWTTQAKERFFASISHELRTPLNAILGYQSLVLDGVVGAVDAPVRSFLERANRAADSLLHLVNDVLDLSKIEAGKMELLIRPISATELVEDAISTVSPMADQKGIRLFFPRPPALPEIRTDADRVRQILVNLLSNSVKFTDQGRVVVTLDAKLDGVPELDNPRAHSESSGRRAPLWLEVRVADTGAGIAPEDQERVFHEFEQVQGAGSRGGTGLGLPISRKLARLLGGDLLLESTLGGGSVFTLRLPLDTTAKTGTAVAQFSD